MSTPQETGAAALGEVYINTNGYYAEMDLAGAVLASLAQHRDDIMWTLRGATGQHIYMVRHRTESKPSDPGWHACTCGWEGYWSQYEPHVARAQTDAVLAYLTGEPS